MYTVRFAQVQSRVTSVDLSLSSLFIERELTAIDVPKLVARLFRLRNVFIDPAGLVHKSRSHANSNATKANEKCKKRIKNESKLTKNSTENKSKKHLNEKLSVSG